MLFRSISRNPVDDNDADYIRYKGRQLELITEYMNLGLDRNKVWDEAFKRLWREFGCCYYSCSKLMLNSVQEDIDEIAEMATQICMPE